MNSTTFKHLSLSESLYHIYQSNPDSISLSMSTLYNCIDYGLFLFRNIDLPRRICYKVRRKAKSAHVMQKNKVGHEYVDFKQHMLDNDVLQHVQIDTVEGSMEDNKCLLTILFVQQKFMLIRLLPRQQANYVKCVFDGIEKTGI